MCQTTAIKIGEIVEKYRDKPGPLIPVLHEVQETFGYLSKETQGMVAKMLNVPEVQVNGVVSFYSFFTDQPKGKYEIGICMGTACYVRGAGEILTLFERELGVKAGQTTEDMLFTLGATRCIGACGLAPVLTVNEDVYGRVGTSQVKELLQHYRKKNV